MKYYLEIWLRGFAKDYLRELSDNASEDFHPHITLARPFEILTGEEKVKNKIIAFCENKPPMFFSLEGAGKFKQGIHYVPVTDSAELMNFNSGLENLLENEVKFAEKLNKEKILHATVHPEAEFFSCPKIDQYALRLTAIKDKKIWFSYDFVTGRVLDRINSLDKTLWHKTVHGFTKKYGLLPTRNGFKKIQSPPNI